jgi:N-acetylneuraminic acid mutarotase
MKKVIFSVVVMMVSFATFAQVQLDKPIQLTGTGADAKIEGIKSVTQNQDAANKIYVDTAITNRLNGSETKINAGTDITITGNGTVATPYTINAAAGSGGGQCVYLPTITPPAGYFYTGYSQELTSNNSNFIFDDTYPLPRRIIRAVAWGNDSIYTFGHEIISGSSTDNQRRFLYRPSTNTWTTNLANQPNGVPYVRYSLEVLNNRIYIINGYTNSTCGPTNYMWEFNPANNTFTARANHPNFSFSSATAVANGRIFVFGGNAACNSFGGGFRNEVYDYNPSTNVWTERPTPMPLATAGHSAETVNGKIYIIGGSRSGVQQSQNVYEYDPNLNTFTQRASLPVGRTDHATAVINNKIYVFGGTEPTVSESRRIDIYDPATNTWARGSNLPSGRTQLAAETSNNRIYIISGGLGTTAYDNNWEYNPAQDTGPVFYMHCKP